VQARPLSALDAIFTRRSVRSSTAQALDETTIRALLDAAVQAPTAMHVEPWAFAVVQDPATLKRISDRAKGSGAESDDPETKSSMAPSRTSSGVAITNVVALAPIVRRHAIRATRSAL
jgi:nitroreductase